MLENFLIQKSGCFEGFFRDFSGWKGHFQIPPFVPPPFAILQGWATQPTANYMHIMYITWPSLHMIRLGSYFHGAPGSRFWDWIGCCSFRWCSAGLGWARSRDCYRRIASESYCWDLLVPTLCRADLGWNFYFGPANCRKIAGEFLSEFWWRILIANFSALFFQGFRPPKKFTPKIHVQNCRHSSAISLSWTQNLFTAIFCLRGRPRIWIAGVRWRSHLPPKQRN